MLDEQIVRKIVGGRPSAEPPYRYDDSWNLEFAPTVFIKEGVSDTFTLSVSNAVWQWIKM